MLCAILGAQNTLKLQWHMFRLEANGCVSHVQVSRLQAGRDVCKQVYEQAKGELKGHIEDYCLYWPDKKASCSQYWSETSMHTPQPSFSGPP